MKSLFKRQEPLEANSVPLTDRKETNIYGTTSLHQMLCEMNRYRPDYVIIDFLYLSAWAPCYAFTKSFFLISHIIQVYSLYKYTDIQTHIYWVSAMCNPNSKIPNLKLSCIINAVLIKYQHFGASDKMILSRKNKYMSLFKSNGAYIIVGRDTNIRNI